MKIERERGAASLKIELKDGVITMYHGDDGVILNQWKAFHNDWNFMFDNICNSFPLIRKTTNLTENQEVVNEK